jgi:hypothetical protein
MGLLPNPDVLPLVEPVPLVDPAVVPLVVPPVDPVPALGAANVRVADLPDVLLTDMTSWP